MKAALRWIQGILCFAAVLLLGLWAVILIDSRMFQSRESSQLDELRAETPEKAFPAAAMAGLVGRIEIPRLNVSVMVMEGDSEAILSHAAGHIPGTSLPGKPGNIGISAHRDSFFRPLRNVRRDDIVELTTLAGSFRYRVLSASIVQPSEVSVLNPGATEVLTLVTCYPFYFIGSAPDRFIVRAERVL